MSDLFECLHHHSFFSTLTAKEIKWIAECGQPHHFAQGEHLAKSQSPANVFYLIQTGLVGVSIPGAHQNTQIIQTIGSNEVFGWSWLFPPYQWVFDAIALNATDCIIMNGLCLRAKLDQQPEFGYRLMKRFSLLIAKRLSATRLQLLDIYGKPSKSDDS